MFVIERHILADIFIIRGVTVNPPIAYFQFFLSMLKYEMERPDSQHNKVHAFLQHAFNNIKKSIIDAGSV